MLVYIIIGLMEVPNEEFDDYVCRAIESVDTEFRVHLAEVPVIVEDEPGDEVCGRLGLNRKDCLLGLFQGVPISRRVEGAGGPSQITLYRKNILLACPGRRVLADKIRRVLIHELGHYLGFSEKQLGKYR